MELGRTSYVTSGGNFLVDRDTARRDNGRQIDWDKVNDNYRLGEINVKLNGAAAIGATSLTVDAITKALPKDTFIKFGVLAPVTVTLADASVSAGDTSITVAALSGPIPANTFLNFTGGTNAQVVQTSAAAAAGATSLTIYPADGTIANTQTALYTGGTQMARLTAAALIGATSLTVDELQFLIADDTVGIVPGTGDKFIPEATVMCTLTSGLIVPREDAPAAETADRIMIDAARQNSKTDAASGYGSTISAAVYTERLNAAQRALAGWATYVTELKAVGFHFAKFSDSRAS